MKGKRIISSLLSMAMVFSLNAGISFADEAAPVTEEPVVEEPVEEEPVVEEPALEEPVEEVPVVEEPAAKDPVAEDVQETEDTQEEEDEEYPAQTFTGVTPDGRIAVEIIAGEGALPKDASMRVENVNNAQIEGLVNAVVDDGQADSMVAVNVVFTDKDGNEIEPLTEIIVNLSMVDFEAADQYQLVHIDQANNPDRIADEKIISINNTQTSFATDVFSIYVVVGEHTEDEYARLTINFYNGDTLIETMYVKTKDPAQDIEKILYDPGAGDAPTGQVFMGWTLDKDYTSESTPYTIQELREYVGALEYAEGDVLDVYAMFMKGYKITYIGEKGAVLGSEFIKVDPDTESIQYTVNQLYTPEEGHNFEGWLVSEGKSNIIPAATDDQVFKNETEITIKGDIKFSVEAPEGHWLIFHENGGTYVAPQFYKTEETTVEPSADDMNKPGYTFDGWYSDEACTQAFTFGTTINDKTDVYAKWTAKPTANYTILIWKQNVDGKTYDFAESVRGTGNVGSNINPGNTISRTYTGFHLNNYDRNVKIKAEGDSVLNVYYDRNEITITFMIPVQHTGWFIVPYTYWTMEEEQSMTGLYGQSLPDAGYTWPSERWWYDNYDGATLTGFYGTGTRTTFLDAFLPTDNSSTITYYGFTGDGNNTVHWLKRNPSGTGYTEFNNATTSNGTFYISDKYNGYKAVSYSTDNRTWTTLGEKDSDGYYGSVSNYSNLYIRYDPLEYNILFMDGAYVGENDIPVQDGPQGRGELKEVDHIQFESNISSYNKGGANFYDPSTDKPVNGYEFVGWYIDDACTHPYTFTNMPEGLTVYAKWRQIQYRVFLHPNAGTDPTLNWGSEDQKMNFLVSSGGKVSSPTGTRGEYEFVGWFLDENYTKPFNGEAFVLNDTTVTAAYDKSVDMTDPMDKWGNGATTNADVDRPWVTKKLDLYGRWRAKLEGAEGIGIIYDANGGSNAPTDTGLYKDTAKATAGTASTAPDNDHHFEYWVVQKWNGSAYEDTNVVVYPGNSFEVLKANARVQENEGSTEENPSYTYTVQLKAVYIPNEVLTPTHIYWYGNGGTTSGGETVVKDENKKINEAVDIRGADTFIKEGYRFVGWERREEGAASGEMFLKYDNETGKFYAKDDSGEFTVEATQVAADEKLPYHDLYAVWESVIYIYHSSTAEKEAISMDELEKDNYRINLVSKVNSGFIYGGWYTEYAKEGTPYIADVGDLNSQWDLSKAGDTPGDSIVINPETDGGKTFYLKEVPEAYLSNYSEMIYKIETKKVVNLFQMSAVDDLNYNDTGFIVEAANMPAVVVRTFIFQQSSGKTSVRRADMIFNGISNPSYLTYLDIKKKLGEDYVTTENKQFSVTPYWITPDGVQVNGKTRTINMANLEYDQVQVS